MAEQLSGVVLAHLQLDASSSGSRWVARLDEGPANQPNIVDAPTADSSALYLTCELSLSSQNAFYNEMLHTGFTGIPQQVRQGWVDGILALSLDWGSENEAGETPSELAFKVDKCNRVTLSRDVKTNAQKQRISCFEYEPHFWLPESCLVDAENNKKKVLRRELFAVACLIHQILTGEKPWGDCSQAKAKSLYEEGQYPQEILKSPYWKVVLSFWSWEFSVKVAQILRGKCSNAALKVAGGGVIAGLVCAGAIFAGPTVLAALGFGAASGSTGVMLYSAGVMSPAISAISMVEMAPVFAVLEAAGITAATTGAAGPMSVHAVLYAGLGGMAVGGVGGAGNVALATVKNRGMLDPQKMFGVFLSVVIKADTKK